MSRLGRIVVLVLIIELVLGAALGTRIRKQLERPLSYLGSLVSSEPFHVG